MSSRRRRRPVALVAAAALAALTACSGSGAAAPATSSSAAVAPAAARLSTTVSRALADVSSAHVDADAQALGVSLRGDLTLAHGRTTATELTLDQGDGPVPVITVGTTSWARLPASRQSSGKPWVVVRADSSDEFVRALAGSLHLVAAFAEVGALARDLRAASAVRPAAAQAGGARSYDLTVDPARLHDALGQLLQLTGSHSVPVHLVLDPAGRPTRLEVTATVAGADVPVTVTIGRYDAPVSITPPPADQVAG